MRIRIISFIAPTRFLLLKFLFVSLPPRFRRYVPTGCQFSANYTNRCKPAAKSCREFLGHYGSSNRGFYNGAATHHQTDFYPSRIDIGGFQRVTFDTPFRGASSREKRIDNPRNSTVATGSRAVFKTLFSIVSRSVCFNGRHQMLGT
jgi:hypothetical protein